jgi:hypothetical protein
MTKLFRGNPRLLLQALPVAAVMVLLKWLYDLSPLKHLELSPLLGGVIAAEVFIVGFILSGTAADFKEAERLPGEVVGSLDSIADECLIMDTELELPQARSASCYWRTTGSRSISGFCAATVSTTYSTSCAGSIRYSWFSRPRFRPASPPG